LFYNGGRVVTYAALGIAAGMVGKVLALAGWQQAVSIALGVLLLLSLLLPSVMARMLQRIPVLDSAYRRVSGALGSLLRRRSLATLFLVGLVNGLLPCGFVYLALAAAATTGDTAGAVLFMVGFGFGTVPVMFAVSIAGKQLRGGLQKRMVSLIPAFGVLLAVLFILRGLNLGIPYVSPHVEQNQAADAAPHCH
jgi:sulfite exporter TauE/SafE